MCSSVDSAHHGLGATYKQVVAWLWQTTMCRGHYAETMGAHLVDVMTLTHGFLPESANNLLVHGKQHHFAQPESKPEGRVWRADHPADIAAALLPGCE